MGAIAGYFMRRAGAVAPDLLERQAALLAHRGPAGSVIHRTGPIGFVHCRDQVLPLVHAAGQVCVDAGGRFVLICNGRIFNHRELARELAPGSARPPSILEVMLQAFMAWGEQAFRRFNGAFACAIWDRQEHALVLARDQCGIKQLFVIAGAYIISFYIQLNKPLCILYFKKENLALVINTHNPSGHTHI